MMDKESSHTHGTAPTAGPLSDSRWPKWIQDIIDGLTGRDRIPHPLQYFLPGKIILQVTHPKTLTQVDLAVLMVSAIGSLGHGRIKNPNPQAILTFPFVNGSGLVFSLVPVEVTSANQQELVDLVVDVYSSLKAGPMNIGPNTSIQAVSPNWLIGSASHGILPPSPGSWPVEAPVPTADEWKFQLIKDVPNKTREQNTSSFPVTNATGTGIHVAILDTAPAKIDLDEAYETWHSRHPLVERLLGSGGKLHVHTGITTDLELMDYSPVGHHYRMADHGLFISGIVNSIAPDATLHLIKVFTPYGVASVETIAQGILEMLRNPEIKRPLIVNCSFGMSIDNGPDLPIELQDPVTLQAMNTSLWAIFDGLSKEKDVVVAAAAGNYAHDDLSTGVHMRPDPRFPAAFGDVVGVGALPRNANKPFTAASYSNRAGSGYMTLGGEPGPGNGLRGIYTSEIPVYAEGCLSFLWRMFTKKGLDGWAGPGHLPPNPQAFTIDRLRYKKNNTGWAWWAGTSFAAPILAGLLATKWSSPGFTTPLNGASAHTELDKDRQRDPTPDGEKVILVTQGKS